MPLLLVHLIATAALAGLVWVVQLVVYPSFRLVGGGPSWPAFHAAHSRSVALATVVVTVAVSVPLHTRLGEAYDDAVARRLVATNWLRTAAWTAGTACAALLVARAA